MMVADVPILRAAGRRRIDYYRGDRLRRAGNPWYSAIGAAPAVVVKWPATGLRCPCPAGFGGAPGVSLPAIPAIPARGRNKESMTARISIAAFRKLLRAGRRRGPRARRCASGARVDGTRTTTRPRPTTPCRGMCSIRWSSADAGMKLVPGLATAWKPVNDTTWEFTLRQGVKFSNGSPFTAGGRHLHLLPRAEQPAGHRRLLCQHRASRSTRSAVKDGSPLVVTTKAPYPAAGQRADAHVDPVERDRAARADPLRPGAQLRRDRPWPKMEDFNSGKNAIGTGLLRLEVLRSAAPGLRWNATTAIGAGSRRGRTSVDAGAQRRPAPDGSAGRRFRPDRKPRSARPEAAERRQAFKYVITPSVRVLFLQLDVGRNPSPQVQAPDGKNPLQDLRVRRAISMASRPQGDCAAHYGRGGHAGRLPILARRHVRRLAPRPELKYDPAGARS